MKMDGAMLDLVVITGKFSLQAVEGLLQTGLGGCSGVQDDDFADGITCF
jgi:hypothetical protein